MYISEINTHHPLHYVAAAASMLVAGAPSLTAQAG